MAHKIIDMVKGEALPVKLSAEACGKSHTMWLNRLAILRRQQTRVKLHHQGVTHEHAKLQRRINECVEEVDYYGP